MIKDIFNLKKTIKNIKNSFSKIKSEMNDHLISINENTNEIQGNYEHLLSLEIKMNKLSERLDEINMALINAGLNQNNTYCSDCYHIIPLKNEEKEIYQLLSRIQEENNYANYEEIALQKNISSQLVCEYINTIIHKGVPIVKRYINNIPHISIEENFRNHQIRTNIIGINADISQKVRDYN
jgi:hypothetical protein